MSLEPESLLIKRRPSVASRSEPSEVTGRALRVTAAAADDDALCCSRR